MDRVETIEGLTVDIFSKILRDHWSDEPDAGSNEGNKDYLDPRISDISATKVEEGVLSDVYRVHLHYSSFEDDTNDKGNPQQQPPSDWLVKFCRPDLGLSWMCRNETIFYRQLAPSLAANPQSLPFAVPRYLCGSDRHLILEEETNIETFPLSEGCPPDKLKFLLRSLAAWHATFWESGLLTQELSRDGKQECLHRVDTEGLVSPAGMGQRLPPLQKEGLFVQSWRETLDYLRKWDDEQSEKKIDQDLLSFVTNLCERLATRRLREVHEKVHRHRVTCVHGDFHIANWLFPVPSTTAKWEAQHGRKPILVDFATAGYGNPLVDLVFFMVVSTDDDVVSDSQQVLENYYRLLLECDPSLSSKIDMATLKEWFPWVLLCQFLILVSYDGLCRGIASAEEDERKRESQIRHFCNVNRRMVLAMRSIGDWDDILSELKPITSEERHEARAFCQNTPLVI